MGRNADELKLEILRQAIDIHPGKRAGFFARLLNWPRESVNRRLASLNDRGILLSEDDQGKLWLLEQGGWD